MFDNIRFYISNKAEFENNICKTTKVDFRTFVSTQTGLMSEYPMQGKYLNMDIRITKTTAYINGSLHKFFNNYINGEDQNYNDFDYLDNVNVIDEIVQYLEIDPGKTKVTNLEFGFNIQLNKDPQKIIDRNVLMYRHSSHSKNLKFSGRGDFKEYEMTDYSVKVYNKSKQYKTKNHIMRIEVKILMKRILERFGVFTLDDLKDKIKIKRLFSFFLTQFNNLLIIDDFNDNHSIPISVKNKLNRYTNPIYWKTNFDYKPDRIRKMHVNQLNKLIKKYKLDSLRNELLLKIIAKYDELLTTTLR